VVWEAGKGIGQGVGDVALGRRMSEVGVLAMELIKETRKLLGEAQCSLFFGF